MRIIFFGTPDFAVPSLEALGASGWDVVSVVTQPDRVKGRGHHLAAPPVKDRARSLGIPVLQASGIKTESFLGEIAKLNPAVIVVVAYGRIIPPSILSLPPLGCVNIHASLLPRYRGAAPIQWAIIRGETMTGVTSMQMDEGLDTGDILMSEPVAIGDDDDALTLGRRISGLGASLLVKTLKGLLAGSVHPVKQEGTPSYAPPLRKEDGRIRWARPAREIFNLIRGTIPWPGASCRFRGERLTILKAAPSNLLPDGECGPGQIVRIDAGSIIVGTGGGFLALAELRPEGRRAMAAADFARGRQIREGMSFDEAD